MRPNESWVARWKGLTKYHPGCYALRVHGDIPPHILEELEEKGIRQNLQISQNQ